MYSVYFTVQLYRYVIFQYKPGVISQFRCCYITVDSAMAALQNGFCSDKLSINKKTIIMQIMTKIITVFIYLIFYQREIVKREIEIIL
jgi:hypothetical protein